MDRRAATVSVLRDGGLIPGFVAALLAAALGLAVVVGPVGIAVGALALAGAGLVLLGPRIPAAFHLLLAALLIGYMFFGRGVAYVGVGVAYVGEIAVVLALAATIVSLGRFRIGVVEVLLLAFMAWGAARTIPYLGQFGPLALRDAVTWAYGIVAIGVAATLSTPTLRRAVGIYRRLVPALVIWFPIAIVLSAIFEDSLPRVPGSPVPFVALRAGEIGVHLAGIAAFALVGLLGGGGPRQALLWAAWGVSAAVAATANRGAMAAAATAAFALLFVRRLTYWLVPIIVAAGLLAGAWLVDPRVDLGTTRTISFQQFVDNLSSIFVDRPDTANQATKEWRIAWWNTITDYTINGPYFWTGKGFGINLADADGFQVNEDGSLRAPHSAHFEILARAGVPGLLLWIGVQAAWAATVLAAAVRARRSGRTWWLAITAWLFVYWMAALVDMSFDVYLGGPQGGIWFWTIFGAGLAVARMVRSDEPDPAPLSGDSDPGTGPAEASPAKAG